MFLRILKEGKEKSKLLRSQMYSSVWMQKSEKLSEIRKDLFGRRLWTCGQDEDERRKQ